MKYLLYFAHFKFESHNLHIGKGEGRLDMCSFTAHAYRKNKS